MFKKIILSAVAIATLLGFAGCSSHTPKILKDNPEKGEYMRSTPYEDCINTRIYDKERVSGKYKMETSSALYSIFAGKDCTDRTNEQLKELGIVMIGCKGDWLPYLFYENIESCQSATKYKEQIGSKRI